MEFILGFFIGFVLASLCFLFYISIKLKSEVVEEIAKIILDNLVDKKDYSK